MRVPTDDKKAYTEEERQRAISKASVVVRKGVKPDQVVEYYNNWAENLEYEKDISYKLYNSPIVNAASSAECFEEAKRGTVRVLDVGAGTGLCGVELSKLGFKNIDGLDPSDGMLAEARKKNVYNKLICSFMTEQRQDIEDNTYDLLTCSAAFCEGHVPSVAINEMVRLTKQGGFIVVVTGEQDREYERYKKDNLDTVVNELEKDGKLKEFERKIFDGYFLEKKGIILKFQVL